MKAEERGKVWLIGGTTESVLIASAIISMKITCIVTVATLSAKTLYPLECQVKVGRMDSSAMKQFCLEENIMALLDASHPYATEVSQNAIDTAKVCNIPYLRYERPLVESLGAIRELSVQKNQLSVIELDDFDALFAGDYLAGKRVLLTIGCQSLHLFASGQEKAIMFARILPLPQSLAMAIAAGFTPDRIIAIRPPISKNLEKALWQQWQISLVITKASGKAGGEELKREVAKELGIPLIIISRPKINYPQQTDSLDCAIAFCRQYVSG